MPTLSELFRNVGIGGTGSRTMQLPYGAGSYQTPTAAGLGQGPIVQPGMNNVGISRSSIGFGGPTGGGTGDRPPVQPPPIGGGGAAPAGTGAPTQTRELPPYMLDPRTNQQWSPEEAAKYHLEQASMGDTNRYAGGQFGGQDQTATQMYETAAQLNNARNDISTGMTDPYKRSTESGIPYTFEEMRAIQKAYAGEYDPAINSALAKLDLKQKEDTEARAFEREKEKMALQFDYDRRLKGIGSGDGAVGDSALSSQAGYSSLTAKQKSQADSINNLVRSLKEYRDTANVGGSELGFNVWGSDSALLETQLNSLLFAAAQAEGTGALQKADREVLQQVIPTLTNYWSGAKNLSRGGLGGVNEKIDNQINKYTQNLSGYGLKPSFAVASVINTPTGSEIGAGVDEEYQSYLKAIGQ